MACRDTYIAVHGGAGMHSYTREKEVKQALRLACKEALKHSRGYPMTPIQGHADDTAYTPVDMVGNAIAVLEDDPLLNAGYGSNLTLHGTVECDAAIMDGRSSDFGSVGAVSGVKNPIRLARAILEHSTIPDQLGRIPPLMLVAEGARKFAAANSTRLAVETAPLDSLVSPKAREDWLKWKARIESPDADQTVPTTCLTDIQDTVGAVACQNADAVAAGVSSGGILLKHPGRIGEVCNIIFLSAQPFLSTVAVKAAIFGAGCWAQYFLEAGIRIACSISGAGEHIVRSMLARTIADSFRLAIASTNDVDAHDILHRVLLDNFWTPCRERGVVDPDVGVLLLMTEQAEDATNVRLWCAFTTPSMAIAYASSINPKPKAQVLRRPKGMDSRGTSEPRIFITAIPL